MRTFDPAALESVRDLLPEKHYGFSPAEIASDCSNYILYNRDGDIALFEAITPGVVRGHYFFRNRGRKAIDAAQEFLDEIFKEDVSVITGLTPKDNRPAIWMNRQLGFRYMCDVDTIAGPMELYILSQRNKRRINNDE